MAADLAGIVHGWLHGGKVMGIPADSKYNPGPKADAGTHRATEKRIMEAARQSGMIHLCPGGNAIRQLEHFAALLLAQSPEPGEQQPARNLLLRWQGAMRLSGVTAHAEGTTDDNPVAKLIRDTDTFLAGPQTQAAADPVNVRQVPLTEWREVIQLLANALSGSEGWSAKDEAQAERYVDRYFSETKEEKQ